MSAHDGVNSGYTFWPPLRPGVGLMTERHLIGPTFVSLGAVAALLCVPTIARAAELGGEVDIASHPGQGTRVTLTLPRA